MNFWTDTHAHIYHKDFDADREEMFSRNRAAGVARIYMPNVDSASVEGMLLVEEKYPEEAIAMMGLHPCSVNADFEKELQHVETWLNKRRFAAVGEIGTDLYWDKTFWEQQQEAFLIQVGWAKKYGLPVVIHCRQSIDETIALLRPYAGHVSGIFHCFSGNLAQAQQIIAMGFSLGIGGVVTFKNGGLDNVVPEIDLSSIVLETDSPYLAPVPHRGKRNEPSYIPLVAQKVMALKRVTLQELQTVTTQNANKIFNSSTAA